MHRRHLWTALVLCIFIDACGSTPPTASPISPASAAPATASAAATSAPTASVQPTATLAPSPSAAPSAASSPASAVPSPSPVALVANWPMLRGSPSRRAEGDHGPVGNPVQRWRFQAKGAIPGPPAAVGAFVYAISDDGVLHALDINTGAEKWSFQGAQGGDMGPIVVDGAVYVTDGDGVIRAVDAVTGKEHWHTAAPVPGGFVVADGRILVSSDAAIVGLDAATGAEQWRYTARDAGLFHKPAFADGIVYASSDSGGYVAVDAATGALRWRGDIGTDATGTAVVGDGIAYIGDNSEAKAHLYAFDAAAGKLLWRLDEPIFSPALSAGIAYSGGNAGYVSAHDTETGSLLWKFPTKGEVQPVAVADGVVYVPAAGEARVYAIDARTGSERWRFSVDGSIGGSLAVTAGAVYVGTALGGVYAIRGDGSTTIAASPSASTAATTPDSPCPPGPASAAGAALPDGWYRTEPVSAKDILANLTRSGIADAAARTADLGWAAAKTVVFSFCAYGGQWHQYESVDGATAVLGSSGTYELRGANALVETDCCSPAHLTLDYQLTATVLRVTRLELDDPDPVARAAVTAIYTTAPFELVAPTSSTGSPPEAANPFSPVGVLDPSTTGLENPLSIALGADGNLYVADGRPRISVITTDGKLLRSWGDAGSGPGEFTFRDQQGRGIAVAPDGQVYVSDTGNHRIEVFTPDGTFVREFTLPPAANGEVLAAFNLAFDEAGNLYTADAGSSPDRDGMTISKIDPAGKLLWRVGPASDPDPDLGGCCKHGLTVDGHGRVWYLNDDAMRVVALDAATGRKVDAFGERGVQPGHLQYPCNLAIDAAGNVFTWECELMRLQVFNPQHQLIGVWTKSDGQLVGQPWVLAPDGRIYGVGVCYGSCAAGKDSSIYVLSVGMPLGGNPFSLEATLDPSTTGIASPLAVAVGRDGNVVVTDARPRVSVVTRAGKLVRSWGSAGKGPGEFDFSNGAPVAIGADGRVYVADRANQRIQIFKSDGTFERAIEGAAKGDLGSVLGIGVDRTGAVYVAFDATRTVSKFDKAGKVVWTVGNETADPDLVGHFHSARVAADGQIWFTNDDAGRVVVLDADGHKVDAFGERGIEPGTLHAPCSVDTDSAGNVYVWECELNRLQVFDPQHRLIGAWSQADGQPIGEGFAALPDGGVVGVGLCAPTCSPGKDSSLYVLDVTGTAAR